jgi:uncharacterized protein GlcG (DUF336 family)
MKKKNNLKRIVTLIGSVMCLNAGTALAHCPGLLNHGVLTTALQDALPLGAGGNNADPFTNGGLDFPMWATVVGSHGEVCKVTTSTANIRLAWPASRVISMQKAFTANSLTATGGGGINGSGGLFSTALLYYPSQPGQFLWGLHQSNPVNAAAVYMGPGTWGTDGDFMETKIPGGVNTFGGGVALFDILGNVIGGVGVSGDTSCADHNAAIRVRDNLVAALPGVYGNNPAGQYADNIIYDIKNGVSKSGFGHPACAGGGEEAVNSEITGVEHPKHDEFPFKK